jgi:hypothetical protein
MKDRPEKFRAYPTLQNLQFGSFTIGDCYLYLIVYTNRRSQELFTLNRNGPLAGVGDHTVP